MKTISFAVPCYNSATYMDKCIESLLTCGSDIEIIIVNDGSSDSTLEHAYTWLEQFPDIVKVVDQENGGHGAAVNAGLAHADALYFKVVDSDDWLDPAAMSNVMAYLRTQVEIPDATDLVISNYVYDKVSAGRQKTIRYANVFPQNERVGWDHAKRFGPSQYLLMHSVIYRTQLLKDQGIKLPHHCFYVDNIFVYVPLPHVQSLYYLDVDAYHYFIGREDQSVNEKVMLGRIDQQLTITREMIDAVNLETDVDDPHLRRYMYNYLSMMMCICTIFLRMEPTEENERKRADIWNYLRSTNETMYTKVRHHMINVAVNLPGRAGRTIALANYHLAQKIFAFN